MKSLDAEQIRQMMKEMSDALLEDIDVKGVEFTVFLKDGCRIYWNSRDSE